MASLAQRFPPAAVLFGRQVFGLAPLHTIAVFRMTRLEVIYQFFNGGFP
jgi:hypothetical protein